MLVLGALSYHREKTAWLQNTRRECLIIHKKRRLFSKLQTKHILLSKQLRTGHVFKFDYELEIAKPT